MRINDNWKKITAIWKIKLVMCLRMIAGWGEGFSEDWIFSTSLRLKLCLDTENISFNHQDHFLPKAIPLLSSSFALKAPCTLHYSADYVCISHFFWGGGWSFDWCSPPETLFCENKDQVSLFSPLRPGTSNELACCRSEWTTSSLKMLSESRIVHIFLKCFKVRVHLTKWAHDKCLTE